MKSKKKELKKMNIVSGKKQNNFEILIESIYARYCYDVNYEFNLKKINDRFGDLSIELLKYLKKNNMVKINKDKTKFKLTYEGFDYISNLTKRNKSFSLSVNSLIITILTLTGITIISHIVSFIEFFIDPSDYWKTKLAMIISSTLVLTTALDSIIHPEKD